MPLVNSNDASLWDGGASSLYRCEIDGRTVGYERAAKQQYYGNDIASLARALNLQPGQRIALIGAGFGWGAEDMIALGLGPIVCCDVSTWIQNNKTGNASVTILNQDGSTNNSRRAIKQALGGTNVTVDWVITEDVLPVLSDAECLQGAGFLRQLTANVAHWVSVGARDVNNPSVWAGDPRLNWKTLEDWKTLMSPDRVVQRGTDRVL